MMGPGMMGFGFGSWGLIGLLIMLLFWGGLIVGAVWLVKALFDHKSPSQNPPADYKSSAREILDQRYARGEITREQYELMKSDIG